MYIHDYLFTCLVLVAVINFHYCSRCGNKVLFGTKTPYKLIENKNINVTHPDGCTPIQINMVYRHGNRYPTRQDVRKMNPLIERINAEYKKMVMNNKFKQSNIVYPLIQPFEEEWDTHLSEVGEQEMYDIGKRLKIRYPMIFNKSYSPMDYSFQSSCKLRCTHSSNALASGIFEDTCKNNKCRSKTVAVEAWPCDRDLYMRFLDNCPKYMKKVIANSLTYYQDNLFGKGQEVKRVINKVKKRLGLPKLRLKHYDLHMLFTLCSYEIGMFNGSLDKGYCKMFDTEDFRVLEYWYDMRNYYKRASPLARISYKSSCRLLQNVYNTLLQAKNNFKKKYYHRAIFRSGHSKTIIPFLNVLELFMDKDRLKANNYEDMKSRKFRTGCTSPFSANIYFALYKCDDGKFRIQANVNERPIRMFCCDSEVSCELDTFLKCYKDVVDHCNFSKRCRIKNEESRQKEQGKS